MLKLVLGLALVFFIGWKLYSTQFFLQLSQLEIQKNGIYFILLAIFLVPVNWGIETIKWLPLMSPANKISFGKAYGLILAGLATGLMTPNRIGNFIGRVQDEKIQDKANGIAATLLANIAQFSATISFGLIALMFNFNLFQSSTSIFILSILASVFLVLGLITFYSPRYLLLWKWLVKKRPELPSLLEDYSKISFLLKTTIFFLAILRLWVIYVQYLLLLLAFFTPHNSWIILQGIALMFFLTTLFPSIAFGKLFVREASALFVLTAFNIPTSIIVTVSLFLWGINLAIPSLIGSWIFIKK